MLTRKQYDLLLLIDRRLKETGIAPSYDEMKDQLNLKSKSGIHRLISGLEERGFIRRLAHRARAIEVLRLPDNWNEPPAGAGRIVRSRFAPSVLMGGVKPVISGTSSDAAMETVQVPLYGKIAAGTPIEALRDQSVTLGVPGELIGTGEHFALEIEGDSMIDAGILDGDVVVVRRCDTAENGAIVVALIDDIEATLKRLRRRGDSIALEPANRRHETRIFGPDRVRVQGRLVGLVRKY